MYLSIILSPKTYSSLESILVINTFFTLVFAVIFFGYAEFVAMTNRVYLKEQEQMMVAQVKDFDQQYYLLVQEEIKHARFIRHDISNYIDQIQYLLDKNSGADSAEASKLLEQLRDRNLEHATKNYCENATVNMILNLEISKAQHYSPDVVIDVSAVVPTLDSIAPLDLSSIVFNTLNNAIRATSEFVGDEKKLEISIRVVNGYLLVKTVNPTNENRNITDVSALKTTKSDTVNHGIGLQILCELADKYNGSVAVEIKDSICTFVVSCKVE
ncbi:MAG: GHKL domain-containing protein [Saccharofermentans sp.]|nr:GHKL domain-containing protein [Saccharofermentans sp.]